MLDPSHPKDESSLRLFFLRAQFSFFLGKFKVLSFAWFAWVSLKTSAEEKGKIGGQGDFFAPVFLGKRRISVFGK